MDQLREPTLINFIIVFMVVMIGVITVLWFIINALPNIMCWIQDTIRGKRSYTNQYKYNYQPPKYEEYRYKTKNVKNTEKRVSQAVSSPFTTFMKYKN